MTSQSGWMEVGDELLPPPSGPGPVTNDPRAAGIASFARTERSAVQRFRRVDQRPLEEDVCAENNYAFFDYNVAPLPQAKTPDF